MKNASQFGPGAVPTFLYYFSSTAIVFALVTSKALDLGIGSTLPQQMGMLGGLFSGFLGTYFNRTVAFSIDTPNSKAFLTKLNDILSKMGYEQKAKEEDVLIYERPAPSKFFSGKVFVQLEGKTATIASRAVQIKSIRKQLEQ